MYWLEPIHSLLFHSTIHPHMTKYTKRSGFAHLIIGSRLILDSHFDSSPHFSCSALITAWIRSIPIVNPFPRVFFLLFSSCPCGCISYHALLPACPWIFLPMVNLPSWLFIVPNHPWSNMDHSLIRCTLGSSLWSNLLFPRTGCRFSTIDHDLRLPLGSPSPYVDPDFPHGCSITVTFPWLFFRSWYFPFTHEPLSATL